MGQYKTIQGDTWDAISFKVYGNEMLFPLLMSANPEHVWVVIFDAGYTLAIPDKPEEVSEDLPPWKRGD
ncbi:phage tail protein [Paenibacillus selenitireducens]|uniref:Phage tail protein n=1 Tax=Paenibacillus selenitireducens TaxID=1324314 RepID=A0A1T2XA76_9BACL|nr:tail protein X [Paenibacillus selenitireducens]OPA76738.1 phage tail protein [Paenibacillus selenitireducens]